MSTVCYVAAQDTGQTWEENYQNQLYLDESKNNSIIVSNNDVTLSIGGFEFNIGESKSPLNLGVDAYPKSKSNISFAGINTVSYNHQALMEMGLCQIVNTDYGAYSAEDGDFLDLNNGKSIHVGINFLHFSTLLNKSRTISMTIGLGLSIENYVFSDHLTLSYSEGMMRPVAIDPSYKKSKLVATYLHMPVIFAWNIRKGLFLAAGINLDLNMGAHTKIKFPKEKARNCHLNPFNAGVTARLGFRRVYVYANYSLMEMFKKDQGPKAHRMSAGIGLWF